MTDRRHPVLLLLHRQRERERRGTASAGWLPEVNRSYLCTDRGRERVPLLDGCRKVTGTASAQTEGERRGRCWMTDRRHPVLLLHRQRKREEAQLLLDGCRKIIGPTSAQTEGERETRPLLDGCWKVIGTASAQTEGERGAAIAG
jgi:hypothetical protein